MNIQIYLGSWLIPFGISLAIFIFCLVKTSKASMSHGYQLLGDAIIVLLYFGVGSILSLLAWLIWALNR